MTDTVIKSWISLLALVVTLLISAISYSCRLNTQIRLAAFDKGYCQVMRVGSQGTLWARCEPK